MGRDRVAALAYVANHVNAGPAFVRAVPLNTIVSEERDAICNMRDELVGEQTGRISLDTETVLDQGNVVLFNTPLFDDVQCNFKLYFHDLINLLGLVGFDATTDFHDITTALVMRLSVNVDVNMIAAVPMNSLIKPIVFPALLELAIKKMNASSLHRSLSIRCVQYLKNLFNGNATVLPEIKLGITAHEAFTLIATHLGGGLDAAQYAKAI